MSGEREGGSRTERPTPRRLREARRRGEVARSRELSGAAAVAGGLAAICALGTTGVSRIEAQLRRTLTATVASEVEALAAVNESLRLLATAAFPICGAALVLGGLVAAAQVGGLRFCARAVAPRLERLDLSKGLRRVFSLSSISDAALGAAKVAGAGLVAWHMLRWRAPAFSQLPRLEPRAAASAAGALVLSVAASLAAVLALFGLADFLLARRRHQRALRMTREEVRRDLKEQEGDPHHKAERRRLHRSLAAAGPISRAVCVVVNPTRLAVALQHRRGGDEAPVVLAKGTGDIAVRIRLLARRAGVPVVRDVVLARALFRLAEVGEEIPEELYEAAAVVLAHVYGGEDCA